MALSDVYNKIAQNADLTEKHQKQFVDITLEKRLFEHIKYNEEQAAALKAIYDDEKQVDPDTISLLQEAIPLVAKNRWHTFDLNRLKQSSSFSMHGVMRLHKKHMFGPNEYIATNLGYNEYHDYFSFDLKENIQLIRYVWPDGSSHVWYGGISYSDTKIDIVTAATESEAETIAFQNAAKRFSEWFKNTEALFHPCQRYVVFPYQVSIKSRDGHEYVGSDKLANVPPVSSFLFYSYILYEDGEVFHYVCSGEKRAKRTIQEPFKIIDEDFHRFDILTPDSTDPSPFRSIFHGGLRCMGSRKHELSEAETAKLLFQLNQANSLRGG